MTKGKTDRDNQAESKRPLADKEALQETHHEAAQEVNMPVIIALLGYGGALPFVALAAAHLLSLQLPFAQPAAILVGYGVAILSFVGALSWGSHLRDSHISQGLYIWSIIPALMGWVALMVPLMMAALIVIAGLIICWWVDKAKVKTGIWPRWMGRLRAHLTLLACLSLSVLLIA